MRGRLVGIRNREVRVPARDGYGGGRIYTEFAPGAVERLRRLTEEAAREKEARASRMKKRVPPATEPAPPAVAEETTMAYRTVTDEEAIALHVKYYQRGESMEAVAARVGMSGRGLGQRWHKMGLPVARAVAGRKWSPAAGEDLVDVDEDQVDVRPAVEKRNDLVDDQVVDNNQVLVRNGEQNALAQLAAIFELARQAGVSGVVSVSIEAQFDYEFGGE